MEIAILHCFNIGKIFLDELSEAGHNIRFISLPDFARHTLDETSLRQLFPDCLVFNIDQFNYSLDLFAPQQSEAFFQLIDFLEIEYIALYQSFRLSGLSHLTIVERQSHIRSLIERCVNLLTRHQINAVIFGGNPHSLSDFILARITEKLDILCYTFQDFPIAPLRSFVYDARQSALPINTIMGCDQYNEAQVTNYATQLSEHYDKTGRLMFIGSSSASTNYTSTITSCSTFYSNQQSGLPIASQISKNYLFTSEEYRFCFDYYAKISKLSHKHVFTNSIKDSIVIFLHVEPEAAVNPGGGLVVSQLELIRLLRKKIPSNLRLLIKEHPSMFVSPMQKGFDSHAIYRSDLFFESIDSMDNTYFVNPESRNSQIFSKCLASVSCGGTTAFEAFISCSPVAVTGYSPLSTLPDVLDLTSILASDREFWSVQQMREIRNKLSQATTFQRFMSILRTSIPGHPNGPMMLCYEPTEVELNTSQLMLARSINQLLYSMPS